MVIPVLDVVDEDGDVLVGPTLPAALADRPDRAGVRNNLVLIDIVGKVFGRVSREN